MKRNTLYLFFLFCLILNCTSRMNDSTNLKEESKKKIKKMRILVYPFENTGEKKFSWISAGMTDNIISDLARFNNLSVITEEDRKKALKEIVSGQKGILEEETITQTGKITGANFILRGSYLVIGELVRVNIRLIEIENGTSIKPIKIDGTIHEIFELQNKITFNIIEDIKEISQLNLDKEGLDTIKSKYRINIEAFELYSIGKENEEKNPVQAIEYFKKAILLSPKYREALTSAGKISRVLNNFSESLNYYEKAISIMENEGKINNSEYANLIRQIGMVYFAKGNLDKSISLFNKSKLVYENLILYNSDNYADLMNNFGIVYYEKGDYSKAIEFYNKAKKILDELELQNTNAYTKVIMNLGVIYTEKEELDKALEYYNISKEIKEKLNLQNTESFAALISNIGVVYEKKGNPDLAIENYLKSKDTLISLKLQTTDDYTMILNNLGVAYFAKNNLDKALEYYIISKEIKEKLNLQNTIDYANVLNNIGTAYKDKGDIKNAKINFEKSKTVYKKNDRKKEVDQISKILQEL